MDTLESSGARAGGFVEWMRGLILRLFGGAGAVEPGAPRVVSHESKAESAAPEFVIAPGGYEIRVPQPQDASCSVGEMLPSVRQGLSLLPPLPHVVVELMREIQDSNSTAASVAAIASTDPALAASIIRTVNGAGFGLKRKITSVTEAVNYLGFSLVKSMVVRLRLDQVLAPSNEQAAADAEDLWVHSLAVSNVADCLAQRVADVDRGFVSTLGLLHDIGKLAIVAQLPMQAMALSTKNDGHPGGNTLSREAQLLGIDHAGLGANLGANWKLPADLVQAIRFHHAPDAAFHASDPPALRKALYIVFVADQLAKYCYAYADHMEIDAIPDEIFDALKLERSIPRLLDEQVRSAIGRAVMFADGSSKRPVTAPRRFCRPMMAAEASKIIAIQSDAESRISMDETRIAAFFAEDRLQIDLQATAMKINAIPTDAPSLRLVGTVSPEGILKLINALRTHQDSMTLPAHSRAVAAMVIRSLLPNLMRLNSPSERIEVSQTNESGKLDFAIRNPGLAFARRLGSEVSEADGRRVIEAELANVLNLGWFERIATNATGDTLLFVGN